MATPRLTRGNDDDIVSVNGQKCRAGRFGTGRQQDPMLGKGRAEQVGFDLGGDAGDHGLNQPVEAFGQIGPGRGHVKRRDQPTVGTEYGASMQLIPMFCGR